jgi:zinc transporter, ZIP family
MGIWIGCIVGALGTGMGSGLSFLVSDRQKNLPALLMGISGGIMLAVVFFDILPEAVLTTGTFIMVCGVAVGMLFVLLLSMLIPGQKVEARDLFAASRRSSLKKMGILLCAGIAIHNFPEGVAVGSGMSLPGNFGWELLLLIFLHDIPEGMAMSLPLRLAGIKKWKILLMGLLVGSPTALGTLVGGYLGSLSRLVVGGCLGFAGGAMLYLTIKEMIPETIRLKDKKTAWIAIGLGIAAGAAMVLCI